MINKDTILSVYTDKQTLLEYLTKIETALDKAVLTSSQLVYEGANNYHFKFVFEDGSFIETPSITLVQPISKVDFVANGNSVHFVFTLMDGETITTQTINLLKPVTAAAVRDGILYLTLSDGTEVSAGSITASFGATTFNGEVIVHGNFHQTDGTSVLGGNAEIDGNLQVNGNQTETGNLSVDGIIAQKKFELDSDLNLTLSTDAQSAGCSIFYQHARISNKKLNIVVALYCPHKETGAATFAPGVNILSGRLTLTTEEMNQLYTSPNGYLDAKAVMGVRNGLTAPHPILVFEINKEDAQNLFISAQFSESFTQSTSSFGDFIWRGEFNFILR